VLVAGATRGSLVVDTGTPKSLLLREAGGEDPERRSCAWPP
jgi:hypothetical protein